MVHLTAMLHHIPAITIAMLLEKEHLPFFDPLGTYMSFWWYKNEFLMVQEWENINLNCGATHLDNLKQNSGKNEIGAAFDGDADRLILLDEEGYICNGDLIILLIVKEKE